ncbi:MAG: efflux RND transporter periplasmic adaptor subunit, partial [Kiritimatiellae bacterium]|nr:efflux RND transporter periplasmic adaptor subunit [Kiritimatiellia bacterium]
LNNAKAHLKYAGLKASGLLVKKLNLQMTNVQMEIDKLENEIVENASICEIQKKGSVARKEIIDTRIKDCEEDIKKLTVRAPISGHVMHLRQFRERSLLSGSKLWKKFVYMKMPDMRSLAFKGLLLESQREFFKEGDTVLLRGRGVLPSKKTWDIPIDGYIASISRLSHDRVEKEEADWGERGKSGVMVYDIVINADKLPDELRIGMHFDCELISSRDVTGPSVPAYYVKEKGGEYFLSFNGRYKKVTGTLVQGYFVLDDTSLVRKKVDLYGEFLPAGDTKTASTDETLFCISGELLPSKTTDVIVKRILGWQKVTWLIDEDTEVKVGDVVARFDAEETDEEISKTTSLMKEDVSVRKALEESTALKKKEGVFGLAKEKNLLAIAEIDALMMQEGRNWRAIFDAELDVERAKITVEHLSRRLGRIKGRTSVSPMELSRLKRDGVRSEFRAEAAVIRLVGLRRGPDKLEIRRAEMALLEQKLKVETLKKQIEADDFRASRSIARSRRKEAGTKRRLDRFNKFKKNLVLKSPDSGVVQYAKIWNSGVFSKVNVGSAVGYRFVLMQIADLDRMYMRVEVPEKYYTMVHNGMTVSVDAPSLADAGLKGTVSDIKFLFEDKRRKDTKLGIYSSHESLGETVFLVYVQIEDGDVEMKPGMIVTVRFPFEKKGE